MLAINTKIDKTLLFLQFISFGVKSGKEFPKADCYLDCRGVVDPSHTIGGTGDDPKVQTYIKTFSSIFPYFDTLRCHLDCLTSRRGSGHEYDKPFVVCCMCAHGIHRSRAMKHILADMFKGQGYTKVEVK